jgi:tetratricopeptide (TPR) repeat protein
MLFFSVLAIITAILLVSHFRSGTRNERRELLRVWNEGNFEQAYEISKNALLENPVDYFLLTIKGFSAYQMGISQINNQSMLMFINECIFSLRKAIMQREAARDGRLFYVLGKAYGYKGAEYADLAVKYLEMAYKLGFDAPDIPEFLGLAYAAIGDYRNSVIAFSKALENAEASPLLLLSIAESYIALGEFENARAYLMMVVNVSVDSSTTFSARLFLAEVLRQLGDHSGAINQLHEIIEETGDNAETRFQLGEIFSQLGDNTRARAEWRRAITLDPAHLRARARL